MKRFLSSLSIGFILLAPALPVSAALFQQSEGNLQLTAPLSDDLYGAGETVTIAQNVTGDLTVAGGKVFVRNAVRGDVNAAAGEISISGDVSDDVRLAGGDVRIESNVNDDVIIAGGKVTIEEGVTIGGDLVIFGGDITMLGTVRGSVKIFGGNVLLGGTIGGETLVEAEQLSLEGTLDGHATLVAEKLSLGQGATFARNVTYWREGGAMNIKSSGGTVTFNPALDKDRINKGEAAAGMAAFAAVFGMFSILSGALLILLLILATKKFFVDTVKTMRASPGWSLMYGLLFVILTPIVSVLFMITIIGLPIGLFLLLHYIFSMIFACALTAMVFAKFMQLRMKKYQGNVAFFLWSVLFLIVLNILTLIPVVGWIVKATLVLMALGALISTKYGKWKKIV